MRQVDLANRVLAMQYHSRPMANNSQLGFRRLRIFLASCAAAAWFLYLLTAALNMPQVAWLNFWIFTGITTPLIAAGTWLIVRGLQWVHAGFRGRRPGFQRPNYN